jgi:hypothetical protein
MAKDRFALPRLAPHLFYFLGLLSCAGWLWGRLPYHNDILLYVYPERTLNLQSLRDGLIPLWNPFITCGLPHLANWQSSFFYPPDWLLNLTGLSPGLVWLALLHCAWAYTGFFLWARSQKLNLWLCALGAFSFAGSAHFIRCWTNLPFVAAASWIPWAFWAFQRLLDKPGPRTVLLAALVLALQLLAGYPIFVFYTWVALFSWICSHRTPPSFKIGAGLAGALSLALTTLQWVPFLDFFAYATHGNWKDFPYYLHPLEFLTLLSPTLLGVPGTAGYLGNGSNSLFGNLYFGLLPCLFWITGLVWKKFPKGFWGFLSLALLLWMALPGGGPGRLLPQKIFDVLEPSKAVGLFLFAACTFSISFLNHLAPALWKKPPWKPWIVFFSLLWLADLLFLPFRLTYPIPDPYLNPSFQREAQTLRQEARGLRVLGLQTESGMTAQKPQLDEELEKEMSGILVGNFLPNTGMVWGIRSCNAYLSLGTENMQNIARYFNRGFPYSGDLLDIAGVRAFLLPQPLGLGKYEGSKKLGGNYLTLNPGASEDMRFVPGEMDLPDRPSVLNLLARPGNRWRQKVYLEKTTEGAFTLLAPVQRFLSYQEVGGYNRPCSSRASIRMDLPQSSYLAFNESYAPGWHAWVDGRPEPILRAYGLFMAVPTGEAGIHQMDFRYEPLSFRLGLFVTLVALAFFAGGVARFVSTNSFSPQKHRGTITKNKGSRF